MSADFQFGQLLDAMTDAFTVEELERLLQERLSVPLWTIAGRKPEIRFAVFQVIGAAERAGWLERLIEAVYRERPSNSQIKAVYRACGLAPNVAVQVEGSAPPADIPSFSLPAPDARGGLESIVAPKLPDLRIWSEALTRVSDQVCRIETDRLPVGTGFLVGPDAVLTCDYVLEKLLGGRAEPRQFTFRFDYKVLPGGARSDGVPVGLASDWLIDCAPREPATPAGPVAPSADRDRLGYVLVRLARRIGDEPPGGAVGGPPRGWVRVPDAPPALTPNGGVAIVHYSGGGSLKISLDAQGLVGPSADGTRVLYRVNTEAGAVGAPCFDFKWNLLAVHEGATDPRASSDKPIGQGILALAIRERLTRLGKDSALGKRS
jgi:hypothetical protein